MKIKVNPLFFAFALILVLLGRGVDFAFCMLSLALHETGHALVGRLRGFVMKSVMMMPYGAVMSADERFDKTSGILIGLAGPMANFLVVILLLGLWWLFPACYGVTRSLLFVNLSIGVFNLLPVYPLDGSRVVLALAKNKLLTIKWLKGLGIATSIIFLALFVLSMFFKINFSLGIIAVFLFYGAAFGTKDETYMNVLDAQSKSYALGVQKRTVKISKDAPLVRFYHHVGRLFETTFEVVDEKGNVVATLTEDGLKTLAANNKLSKSYAETVLGEVFDEKGAAFQNFSKNIFLKSNRKNFLSHRQKRH